MELLLLIVSAVAGGVFGWLVPTQALAVVTLIGLTIALLGIGIGAGNPTRANVYLVFAGFCVLLFIFGAWTANTLH